MGKSNLTVAKKQLPRNALVIRTWDTFEYREEDILHLRALISELSLGSGGEYDVHLLVQVKDEGLLVQVSQAALAAVLAVLVRGHEDTGTARLGRALATKALDLAVRVDAVVLEHGHLDRLALVL